MLHEAKYKVLVRESNFLCIECKRKICQFYFLKLEVKKVGKSLSKILVGKCFLNFFLMFKDWTREKVFSKLIKVFVFEMKIWERIKLDSDKSNDNEIWNEMVFFLQNELQVIF